MIYAVMCGYPFGWLVVTIMLAVVVSRMNDPNRPQPHPIRVAVAAGAVWPLVIMGAVQIAAVALVVDATRYRRRRGSCGGRAMRRSAGTVKGAHRRSTPGALRPRESYLDAVNTAAPKRPPG